MCRATAYRASGDVTGNPPFSQKLTMPDTPATIAAEQAQNLARRLESFENQTGGQSVEQARIVLAESCTAGLVSALLGQVPGISRFLCGSMVTYRESAKRQWLSVSAETLDQFTAESLETSQSLAAQVLERTPEASFSAAITGHLGPLTGDAAPSEKDGKVFVVVAKRENDSTKIVSSNRIQLQSNTRIDRQYESAAAVINALSNALEL